MINWEFMTRLNSIPLILRASLNLVSSDSDAQAILSAQKWTVLLGPTRSLSLKLLLYHRLDGPAWTISCSYFLYLQYSLYKKWVCRLLFKILKTGSLKVKHILSILTSPFILLVFSLFKFKNVNYHNS